MTLKSLLQQIFFFEVSSLPFISMAFGAVPHISLKHDR
jgi:hypothetical protein